MSYGRIKFSLILTYFVFAILLNSVGTVILQVINTYDVSKAGASVLEGFKDLPIAIVSFLIASYLPKLGYRNAMVVGLSIVTIMCCLMPLIPSFLTIKILFLSVGVAFAMVKVSVYSTIGLITETPKGHASFLNNLEGFFMIGVLSSYWLFGYFVDSTNPKSSQWLNVYWIIAGLCLLNILLLLLTPFHQSKVKSSNSSLAEDFVEMLKLVYKPMVYVFVISAFLYVVIEQGIGTWLPTFNNEVLKLPLHISIQVASIFAACLAIGRLSAGVLLNRFNWYPLLLVCLIAMGTLIIVILPLTENIQISHDIDWYSLPLAAWIFPLIGLFMAPIYPIINSVILSALPKHKHASMTGLIVVFSALGGTSGSLITGVVFSNFDGQTAFYLTLIPILTIMYTLTKLKHHLS